MWPTQKIADCTLWPSWFQIENERNVQHTQNMQITWSKSQKIKKKDCKNSTSLHKENPRRNKQKEHIWTTSMKHDSIQHYTKLQHSQSIFSKINMGQVHTVFTVPDVGAKLSCSSALFLDTGSLD